MSQRPHGYARYRLDACRCDTCRAACSAYNRRTTMAKTAGTWQPFVDAQPVREHIAALAAAGIGLRRAAQLAGLDRKCLQALTSGVNGRAPSTKVRPKTARAILAVEPDPTLLPARQIVDGVGTTRRIQALTAIGWSLSEQARRIGWTTQNYAPVAHGRPITAATARLIADLYDQLAMTPAPAGYSATRTRRYATAKGWAPPLAWDDDHIDDPGTRPGGWIGQPRPDLRAEFLARYQAVAGQGLTWAEIADRLGVTVYAAKGRVRKARAAGLLEQVAA